MKTTKIILIALFATLSMTFTACREDGPVSVTLSEEDVAEIVEYAVSAETAGMVEQVETSAQMAESYSASIPCGDQRDSTLKFQSTTGSRYTYAYSVSWDWTLACNALSIPDSFQLYFAANGSYETLRMESEDESEYNFVLNGLKLSQPDLIYKGSMTRSGSQESKVRNKAAFSSDLEIHTTDLTVSKASQEITGGTAEVTLDATLSNGGKQSFTGKLTFLGARKATFEVNGLTFNLSW